jgi:hypothetical protein
MAMSGEEQQWHAVVREVVSVRDVLYRVRQLAEDATATGAIDLLLADADRRLSRVIRALGAGELSDRTR